jgi:hypothetical protein
VLVVGIILVVAGIFDFIAAAFIAGRQSTSTSGVGGAQPQRAAFLIRRVGLVTIVVGLVLIVLGLTS